MKKKILSSLIVSSLLVSPLVAAETTVDTKSTAEQSQSVDMGSDVSNLNSAISSDSKAVATTAEDKRSAEEILSDVMESYIDQNNLRDKYDYVGSAIGTASVNQTNSNYVDSAQLAFEKALIKAQAEYISFISANTKVDKSLSIDSTQGSSVNDINTDSDKPKEGTQAAIDAKQQALEEAKLDKQLKDQGLNPDDFATPDEKRKALLSQQMTVKSLTTGFGNLSGLLPIKTFVVEKNGNAAIGVVVIYSDKIKGMFEDIKHGHEPVIVGKGGQSPSDLYKDKSGEDMMGDYGIRVGFGEDNKPYILSYGQGSYTGPKLQGVSAGDYGYKQAEIMARANLVTLIAGQMSTKEALTMSEDISSTLAKNTKTQQTRRIDATDIEKTLSTYYKTKANLDIIGLKTVKRWRYKLPSTENTVYGVVLKWDPKQVATANKIKNFNYDEYRKQNAKSTEGGETSLNGKVIIRQSDDNKYLNQF
ncbi:hypothetical protein IB633_07390 [Francisella philomiragia]|uniref:DUF6844 domain-containing protein n=1 Tax=Francisella philomiragia subsp. philomiragia (strain ATCC 25017 / CCUG 19701 / FSC 153 / O\|nr:hypothetical protein [Francisella philomiragia]AJI47280.1 hypothetical protein BF30_1474 [Francisella philomiragia]AJI49839.1 hypothetical protein KU46_85 [Francisella philomiragia]AJI58074.1 hypothetical protein LA02_845 [Francisella philomiragia]MBK2020691.1 hypothetical protein [Francisella philomiragia]MBK2030890.1 hypothetical protein [Francisella philomiragia]